MSHGRGGLAGAAAAALAAFVGLPGCAPLLGARRLDPGASARVGVPVLCFEAVPDRGVWLALVDERLLPGECAELPAASSTRGVRVELAGPSGVERCRRVHPRGGDVTVIAADADGHLRVGRR